MKQLACIDCIDDGLDDELCITELIPMLYIDDTFETAIHSN